MTAVQTAFENYMHGKLVNLTKRADGRYVFRSTREAFREFKAIYEIGFAAGSAPKVVIGAAEFGARPPIGKAALQALADQAQAMGMGYGD